MPRRGPLLTVLALLGLLAAAGVVPGMTGLLMVAPFFVLVGFLLVGLYPGERVVHEVIKAMSLPPRRPAAAPRLHRTPLVLTPGRLLSSANGSRGPPSFA